MLYLVVESIWRNNHGKVEKVELRLATGRTWDIVCSIRQVPIELGTTIVAATTLDGRGAVIASDTRISRHGVCVNDSYYGKIQCLVKDNLYVAGSGSRSGFERLVYEILRDHHRLDICRIEKVVDFFRNKIKQARFGCGVLIVGVDDTDTKVFKVDKTGCCSQDGVLTLGSGGPIMRRSVHLPYKDCDYALEKMYHDMQSAHSLDIHTSSKMRYVVIEAGKDAIDELVIIPSMPVKPICDFENGVLLFPGDCRVVNYMSLDNDVPSDSDDMTA